MKSGFSTAVIACTLQIPILFLRRQAVTVTATVTTDHLFIICYIKREAFNRHFVSQAVGGERFSKQWKHSYIHTRYNSDSEL
jgi:hypothetical protein